jgi:hypothetical protein
MKKNINSGIVCIMLAALSISSCKKFLNVNTNPNVAQEATVKTLLPAAELYVGTAMGVEMEIAGSFWAQYWTQSPGASQFHVLDQYAPGQDVFSTSWTNLYAGAENFYQLFNVADTLKKKQYMAISLLMRAYTFQVITDGWGDVPFRQALKGQYADGHIINPKYDSQMVVYAGIITFIDSANKLLSTADLFHPGSDDLIYGGKMLKWIKFSNTLKLKIYLRMSEINPAGARAGIAALYASAPAPVFIGVGDDAVIKYGFNSANSNPLASDETGLHGTQNLVGSSTAIDSMNSNSDPRINIFYQPTTSGAFSGIPQGFYQTAFAPGTFSLPSAYVAGDALDPQSSKAPVNLLTSYESLFLQAEVSARGWANPGMDSSLFFEAINASFTYYNDALTAATGVGGGASYLNYITAGGYWVNYPATGTLAQKLSFIITQKWFAMCGNQGFEAWTEWRRTGYPNFLAYSKTTLIGNTFPRRFLYPTTESTTNSSYPGLVPLTAPVWWDKH